MPNREAGVLGSSGNARFASGRAACGVRHARSEQATPQRHMLHMVAEAMLGADRVAKITRNGPGTANSCRAYVAARGAPTQVISGGRSQWRNRPHGAYRGLVNRRWWLRTRTHFLTRTYWRTSRARCATRAAPLRNSRPLAEFGTQRSGLNKKSEPSVLRHVGAGTEGWTWSPHPELLSPCRVLLVEDVRDPRKTFHHQKDVAQGSDLG